jgi:hypothetical protein
MDRDLLREKTEAGGNNALIRRQAGLTLLRELIRHQEKLIVLRQELIHLLHVVEEVVQEVQPAEEVIQAAEDAGDNKMKKYFLTTAFLFVLTITLTGCYTAIWNPGDNNFPTKDNSLKSVNNLYAQSGFDYYDNSPWWWEIDPPIFDYTDNSYEDGGSVTTIIDFVPIPFNPPPVGRPIVRPPVNGPTPLKPADNKDKSQDVRAKDSTNNNSSNARNDNGSRNTDTGRKR